MKCKLNKRLVCIPNRFSWCKDCQEGIMKFQTKIDEKKK